MSTSPHGFPGPADMIKHLNRLVVGQQRAKRELVTCFNNHFLGAAWSKRHPREKSPFGRNHALLFGPTGCGKSFLIGALADYLVVPFYHASAKSLVEVGYVGQQVDTLLRGLYLKAARDVDRAQRGVIFIDEIDKLRRSRMSDRDVSGEGVQNSLLTYLDGHVVSMKLDGEGTLDIDTSGILFVGAGAFVGLEDIVRKRRGSASTIGFSGSSKEKQVMDDIEALDSVEPEDLERFGFIPELIGRFATIASLHPLNLEDYVELLNSTEENASGKLRRLFRINGIDLRFTPDALTAVARQARDSGLGVRGLERVVRESVSDLTWQLEDLACRGVTRVLITEDVVLGQGKPVMTHEPRKFEPHPEVEALREEAARLFRPERITFGEERLRSSRPRRASRGRRRKTGGDLFEPLTED